MRTSIVAIKNLPFWPALLCLFLPVAACHHSQGPIASVDGGPPGSDGGSPQPDAGSPLTDCDSPSQPSPLPLSYSLAPLGDCGGECDLTLEHANNGNPLEAAGFALSITDTGLLSRAVVFGTNSITEVSPSGRAFDVNDIGQVVGANFRDSTWTAFLFTNGASRDLGTLGGNTSWATSLNASGQVVGWSLTEQSAMHAFFFDGTAISDLNVALGGPISYASRINDRGLVVGFYYDRDFATLPFLYNSRTRQMVQLTTLGGRYSQALDINRSCQVVGSSAPGAGNVSPYHAFRLTGNLIEDLGTLGGGHLSTALSINNLGQVTGTYIDFATAPRAFVYGRPSDQPAATETMIDLLGSVQVGADRWVSLADAYIRDDGVIVGNGTLRDGTPHPYIATPIFGH